MNKTSSKVNEVSFIIEKVNDDQFLILRNIFKKSGWKQLELDQLERMYASKKNILHTHQNYKNKKSIFEIYKDEINKISFILEDKNIIHNIGGLKILFYGETGTGKTRLVKEIIKLSRLYHFEDLHLENLISAKMGQTQLNLINLANDLNQKYSNQKVIIFIDEFDSIITKRNVSNDVGEHSRVVATFIKFLDLLNENIALFCATNIISQIDIAIVRRFNLQIEGKKIDINKFFELFFSENNHYNYSKRILNDLIKQIDYQFKISELNDFQTYIQFEKKFINEIDPFIEFCMFFKNKLNLKNEMFSERRNLKLTKRGFNEKI